MALYTISDLKYITREELASLIRNQTPGLSIIDVRGDDHIGGHIVGSQNIPTSTNDYRMPELVRSLLDQDTVVFHCTLSQQRGPSIALSYMREKDRMSGKGELGARRDGGNLKERQTVMVLRGGFVKWQEM